MSVDWNDRYDSGDLPWDTGEADAHLDALATLSREGALTVAGLSEVLGAERAKRIADTLTAPPKTPVRVTGRDPKTPEPIILASYASDLSSLLPDVTDREIGALLQKSRRRDLTAEGFREVLGAARAKTLLGHFPPDDVERATFDIKE